MNLKFCTDSSNTKRPLIILVLGFLTEQESSQSIPRSWFEPVQRFALENDYAFAFLPWASKSVFNNNIKSLNLQDFTRGSLSTWKEAVKEADKVAIQFRSLLKNTNRPIILLGHSLGARICLKALERIPKNSIQTLIALAPAYENSECKFERVRAAIDKEALICYSRNDHVLRHLFSLAQNQKGLLKGVSALKRKDKKALLHIASHILFDYAKDSAIGTCGIPSKFLDLFVNIDVSPIGHMEYCNHIYQFLNEYKSKL